MHPLRSTHSNLGTTLIDLMIVVAVIAIIAMIVAPSVSSDQPISLISAATVLASDLEYAQSESITNPGDPTILRVDQATSRYWLARTSSPEVPIDRPDIVADAIGAGAYEVRFGTGDMQFLAGISISIEGGESPEVPFDAFGRLSQTEDARLRLANESGDLFVLVSASTGSVSIEE